MPLFFVKNKSIDESIPKIPLALNISVKVVISSISLYIMLENF